MVKATSHPGKLLHSTILSATRGWRLQIAIRDNVAFLWHRCRHIAHQLHRSLISFIAPNQLHRSLITIPCLRLYHKLYRTICDRDQDGLFIWVEVGASGLTSA